MEKTVQEIAQAMLNNLETKTRTNGQQYVCNKIEIGWQKEIIRKAHEDALPDDYKYEFIQDALLAFSDCEAGNEEDAIMEIEADCYTGELTAWLSSRNDRVYYITEVQKEFGPITDGFQLLMAAQQKEKQDVARLVLEGIKEYINND